MTEREWTVLDRDPIIAPPVLSSTGGQLEPAARVLEPRGADVGVGRWRVWAPIAMRAAALGIALVGLAGIGAVVSHAAPPPVSPAVSRAGFELGALSDRALVAFGAGGSDSLPAPAEVSPLAPPSSSPPAPSSDPQAPAPCPHVPSGFDPGAPAGAASRSRDLSARDPRPRPDGRPVVLNAADAAELRRLPGVGAKRAEAILALRQRLGRFRKPADLLRVKGIGPRTLQRMLPYLVLD